MSDDTQPTVEQTTTSEAPEQAKAKGYMTYDEWTGAGRDPSEYKGEKAYQKDGELFSYIQHQNKTIDRLQRTVDQLNSSFQNVEKVTREKTIQELQGKIKAAASVADVDNVTRYTEQLTKASSPPEVAPQDPMFGEKQIAIDFMNSNKHLLNTPDKFTYATQVETFYRNVEGLSGQNLFDRVKTTLQDKFGVTTQQVNPITGGGHDSAAINVSSGKKGGYESLNGYFKTEYNRQLEAYGDKFDKKNFVDNALGVQAMEGK